MEMQAEAEDMLRQKGVSNIEFRIEDVHELNFPDDQFDIVASRFAPHHFFEIRKALREMCRVLKPGGSFIFLAATLSRLSGMLPLILASALSTRTFRKYPLL